MIYYNNSLESKKFIIKLLCVIGLILTCLLSSCSETVDNNTIINQELALISDEEKIVNGHAGNLDVLVVTDKGNCYISGSRLSSNRTNGVNNIDAYNSLIGSPFVCIYKESDAKDISFNQYGGTIITENDSVYLFLNDSELYRVPTFFASGYRSAVVYGDYIYMLSSTDELGYMKADGKDDYSVEFHTLGESIKKFIIENKDDYHYAIFAQTFDQKLYILESNEVIDSNTPYIEGVIDFDIICSDTLLDVFTTIDTAGNAHAYIGNKPLCYNSFKDIMTSQTIGTDIQSVTAFGKCVAMVNSDRKLSLYGFDFQSHNNKPDFSGEVILYNVNTIFGGNNNLYVVTDDTTLHRYGRNPSTGEFDKIKKLK